ncbi:hypothetical protein V2J09_005657 [Rumex salicifolius]
MGQSSKKKKRKNKARGATKDHHHSSQSSDYNEIITEEFTALCAIFQEDCKVVSESPPQVSVDIRPYSKDTGYESQDVSANLLVRCITGYPHKCPKLQITAEKGLSQNDADKLLSLLYDQANSNAREGRVMIFNLVEAAQEFLSEIVPVTQIAKPVMCLVGDADGQISLNSAARLSETASPLKEPFVYGFVDLFTDYGESWHLSLGSDNSSEFNDVSGTPTVSISKQVYDGVEKNFIQKGKVLGEYSRFASVKSNTAKLETLEEESEDESKSVSSTDSNEIFLDVGGKGRFDYNNDEESESSGSSSSTSIVDGQASQIEKKDLVMAHLLRLACGANSLLADALPEIASELYSIGVLPESVRDIVTNPSYLYSEELGHLFNQHMVASKFDQFWEPVLDFRDNNASSHLSSRYLSDFEELRSLGHGGFGYVVLCKNKLDGRQYAVKKIRLKDKNPLLDDRILREVATLARLQHQHVVRYYQAWFETGVVESYGESSLGSRTAMSSSHSNMGDNSSGIGGPENKIESTYLYIQMEYCPRTLRQLLESYNYFDKDLAWHLFRQVVEGLGHIHGQGIIHRDLTPNNIFFDARNDIKIGDFGLAKFLKREQLDQDQTFPSEVPSVSIDGTGQVGTYFYTAPEIEQGWPKIDEKADMYSLGIVFFELWHPFGTAMERHVVLSDLKQKKELPVAWMAEFPEQATLLRRLMAPSPSDRPSATELIQNAFPPRMEYQLLDKFLRTMQTSEDTTVYDRVVSSIFDEDMMNLRSNHQNAGKLVGNDTQHSQIDTLLRDHVTNVTQELFKQHCGKHLEILPMHLLDDSPESNRKTVKLLTRGGDMIELCYELRSSFVKWMVANQISSLKRYDISYVYRRAIGHSPPNRYLQGDFDIIGGAPALTEAEVIKVTMDVLVNFFHSDSCDIHLNHGNLLEAIWCWIGIKPDYRLKVAELLSLMGNLRPQSAERKSRWVVIRRQLLQELKLPESVVNRLQSVSSRFCAPADQALPRLRGALPADKSTRKALDDLSELFNFLRVWKIESNVYLRKESPGIPSNGTLLALGGRYDHLLRQTWRHEHRSSPPGAVGISIAVETIIKHSTLDFRPFRTEASVNVLVCSKGGGGLLDERMELAAELWEAGIKAEFVPSSDPSLTEQYEYANENDIKCLVIITDSEFSQKDCVKVRYLENKREKEVNREVVVKFLLDAMASQFRNPSIWS